MHRPRAGLRDRFPGIGLLLLPFLALLLPACDPCSGVAGCATPRLRAQGNVILYMTRGGAEGARVEFRYLEGPRLTTDTVVAHANRVGDFLFDVDAEEAGVVKGMLVFHAPGPYEHFVYHVETEIETTRGGNVQSLGRFGVGPIPGPPHVHTVARIVYEETGEPAAGIPVEFVRTGGVAATPGRIVTTTTAEGYFSLKLRPAGDGTVEGEVRIVPPEPYQPITEEVTLEVLRGRDDFRWLALYELVE